MPRTTLLALALLTACAAGARADEARIPQITVQGSAHVEVKPDMAIMRLGVVAEKPTAAGAAAEVASASNAVIATLESLGVERKDIRTYSVDLDPVMADDRDAKTGEIKRTLTGYRASNLLDVTVHDVAKAAALAGRVIDSGANTFHSLSFEVSDYDAQLDLLRPKAVADAMRVAALYAGGAHMKLGRLLDLEPVQSFNAPNVGLPTMKMATGPQRLSIPVEPGVQPIDAQVRGTWELLPE